MSSIQGHIPQQSQGQAFQQSQDHFSQQMSVPPSSSGNQKSDTSITRPQESQGPQWDPNIGSWYEINRVGDKIRYVKPGVPKAEVKQKKPAKESNGLDSIQDIFPNDYKPPTTILTAIRKISKGSSIRGKVGTNVPTVDPLKVTQSCNYVLYKNVNLARTLVPENYRDMTIEEAKTIVSYTYNASDESDEVSPFREVNNTLRQGDPDEIKGSIDMIYMLLKSLRKIPPTEYPTLYRGVNGSLVDGKIKGRDGNSFYPELEYKVGNTVVFKELTSTSTARSVPLNFLEKNKCVKEFKTGIVFKISGGRGYDLKPFSMYESEKEILMDVESKFRVTKVSEDVEWDLNEITKEEKEEEDRQKGIIYRGKPPTDSQVKTDIYKITLIEMEYITDKTAPLPFQARIDEMKKKETDRREIPKVTEYRGSKAPHAKSSDNDEIITQSTSSGRAIELNMRTGEVKEVGSTLGLPKGWVELTEKIDGVKVTYYTNGERKQYERPYMRPYEF